jgi:hypothetical protein
MRKIRTFGAHRSYTIQTIRLYRLCSRSDTFNNVNMGYDTIGRSSSPNYLEINVHALASTPEPPIFEGSMH